MPAETHVERGPMDRQQVVELIRDRLADILELDPDSHGGAMLLGTDGVCIISHGSSSATAIVNAVRVAKEMVDADLVAHLRDAVA